MERQLTLQEILTLAQEHQRLIRWQKVQQHAYGICGARAHEVRTVVDIFSQKKEKNFPGTHYVAIYDKNELLIWADGIFPEPTSAIEFVLNAEAEPSCYFLPDGSLEEIPGYFTPDGRFVRELHQPLNPDHELYIYNKEYIAQSGKQSPFMLFPPFDKLYEQKNQLSSFPAAELAQLGTHHYYSLDEQPTLSYPTAYLKEGDNYRHTLKAEEMIQLSDMHRDYHNWTEVNTIVSNTYGPQAHIAVLESLAEYNDEGGLIPSLEFKEVQDRAGNILTPDVSLPFWQKEETLQIIAQHCSYCWYDFTYQDEIDFQEETDIASDKGKLIKFIKTMPQKHLKAIIDYMFYLAHVNVGMAYNLDQPPVAPPTIYASIA